MLIVAPNLASFTLAAGEPFLFQLAFQDAAGNPVALGSRAFALSIYRSDRKLAKQILGVLDSDSSGAFVRFEADGTLSEQLAGFVGLQVEVAERFAQGRNVIVNGTLSIANSAQTVPSLDGAAIGRFATRVTAKASAEPGMPTFAVHSILWASGATVPAPVLAALSLAASSIVENSAAGTVVGGILNATSGSTLSLVDSAGNRFAISGGNIVAGSASTDYETATSHSITIRETLAGASNTPRDTVLTIAVQNVYERPNLSALSFSSTAFTVGTAASGSINGATAGSTITAANLPTGVTINGAARTWAYDGTGTAGSSNATLTETLADSANSPRQSSVTITKSAAASSGPTGFSMNGSSNPSLKAMMTRVRNGTGRGRIVAKGDSTTVGDGGGSSARADGARQNRWPTVLATKMTAAGVKTIDAAIVGTNNIQSGGTAFPVYDPRVGMGSGTPWTVNGTGATNASISQQFAGGSWLTNGAIAQTTGTNTYPLTMVGASYDTTNMKFGTGALSAGYGRRADGSTIVTSPTSFTIDLRFLTTTSGLAVALQLNPNLWFGVNNGKPFFGIGNAAGDHAAGTTLVNDGVWHHGRICADATSLRFYVDGVLQATAAALTSLKPTGDPAAFAIGGYLPDHTYDWNGEIDDAAVFAKPLTTGSTYTVPTAAYTGTEADMLALYRFDGNGNDASGNVTLNNCFSLTEVCDRFEVVIYDTTAGSTIAFWLDGVSVTAVGNPSTTTANSGGFQTFTIAAPSAGTHTLSIGATAGSIDLRSVRPYTSTAPAADIVVQASCAATSGDQAYSNGQNRNLESLALDAPDLTILLLGFNDANTGVATSTFSSNLGANIDKAKVSGDVLVVGSYKVSGGFESATLRAAAGSVASSKGVAFMDLNAYYGGNIPTNMYDQVHRTAAGYGEMGTVIQQAIAAMAA